MKWESFFFVEVEVFGVVVYDLRFGEFISKSICFGDIIEGYIFGIVDVVNLVVSFFICQY